METITIQQEGQSIEVELVAAFGPDGKPAELIGDTEPESCDHKGAAWSSCLALRCPRCGSRMFLPPRFLAGRSEAEVEDMHALWVRAGWPEYSGNGWLAWAEDWTVIQHPSFAHVGGLAVRNDRLDSFPEARP